MNLVGTATASATNCVFMRWKELEGVKVFDKDRKELGSSQQAGKQVLQSMVVSRATLSGLGIGIPMVLMLGLSRLPAYAR